MTPDLSDAVVVAEFRRESEAENAWAALEADGIAAEWSLRDETLERLCSDVIPAGYDVIVPRADASRAIARLREIWPDEAPVSLSRRSRCPDCGAFDIARLPRVRMFVVAAVILITIGTLTAQRDLFYLLTGIIGVLLAMTPAMFCRVCGERWRGGPHVPLPESAAEPPPRSCPRCGSEETERLERRRHRALTLLVNWVIPPTLLVWPFLARFHCMECDHEWR